MTMHDDPDLELLERDLRKLAEPQQDDEQIRLAVRAQLDGAAAPTPTPTPARVEANRGRSERGQRRGAAAVLVLVVGTNGSGGPTAADAAIIHHALTAVTPPAGDILHTEMTGAAERRDVCERGLAADRPAVRRPGHQGAASRGVLDQRYDRIRLRPCNEHDLRAPRPGIPAAVYRPGRKDSPGARERAGASQRHGRHRRRFPLRGRHARRHGRLLRHAHLRAALRRCPTVGRLRVCSCTTTCR